MEFLLFWYYVKHYINVHDIYTCILLCFVSVLYIKSITTYVVYSDIWIYKTYTWCGAVPQNDHVLTHGLVYTEIFHKPDCD